MKPHLFATVSSLALISAASAADLPAYPTKAPPAVIAPSWTGPYVGLNGGVAWHRAEGDFGIVGSSFSLGSAKVTATGGTAGAQVGYNWQRENFLTGLEADWNWVGGSKSTTRHTPGVDDGTFKSSLEWLATVRVRAGVTFSPTLLYVTGGLAIGRVKNDLDMFNSSTATGEGIIKNHQTRTGWTIGAGIEHMFAPNWTAKAEVLYVDLGRKRAFDVNNYTHGRFKNTATIGRLGINFKW